MADRWLGRRLLAAVRLVRDEMRVTRAVRTVLARHEDHARMVLRTQVVTASVPPDAFGMAEWDTEIDSEVAPIIVAMLTDQSGATLEFLKLDPAVRARILGFLDIESQAASFTERIKGVGPTVASRLEDALREGINKGESIDKLAERVDGAFRYGRWNAETIARTETHGAAETTGFAAASTAAREAGLVLTKSWLTAGDDRVRPSHDDAETDNEAIPIDEPFTVGDEELMFPGDPDGGVEVINCRCTAIYEEAGGGETEVDAEA